MSRHLSLTYPSVDRVFADAEMFGDFFYRNPAVGHV